MLMRWSTVLYCHTTDKIKGERRKDASKETTQQSPVSETAAGYEFPPFDWFHPTRPEYD